MEKSVPWFLRVFALILNVVVASCQDKTTFYRVTGVDARLCPSPYCGGYFLEEVNNQTAPAQQVLSIIVPPALQSTYDDYVYRFGYTLVLFRGFLVPYDLERFPDVFSINVTIMYLGLPGTNVTTQVEGQAYYTVSNTADPYQARAIVLNNNRAFYFNKTSMPAVAPAPYLDAVWQKQQILSYGAIVTANVFTFSDGVTLPVLVPLAVFIKYPLPVGLCSTAQLDCGDMNTVYTRTSRLCFQPSCIDTIAPCVSMCPKCATGYKLSMWNSPPVGCPVYACDPYFAPNASMSTC